MIDHDRMSPHRPPAFCSRDGMALMDKRAVLKSGYDVLTGVELPSREHVTRECPTAGHDVWVLVDSGEWTRP